MIMGKPADTQTLANIGPTGVDEQAGWIFRYSNGALAMLLSSWMKQGRKLSLLVPLGM